MVKYGKTQEAVKGTKRMPQKDSFIRWAGGKTWFIAHLDQILSHLKTEHYHEPFLGSGAVFFSLHHSKRSYLSDANKQLVNAYIQVRDRPNEVIESFLRFRNTEEDYYTVRDELSEDNTIENAARFIFLNQTSYNGIFRVNKEGKYNVPYGFRTYWRYDTDRILRASRKLRNTRIVTGDFEINKYRIKKHDLVFLDPPYTVSHNTNGFIAYNQKLFSLEDQYRLNRFIDYIKRKDAYYILTNAAHETITEIFERGDRRLEFCRQSLIGGKNAARQTITEFVFTNIPEGE